MGAVTILALLSLISVTFIAPGDLTVDAASLIRLGDLAVFIPANASCLRISLLLISSSALGATILLAARFLTVFSFTVLVELVLSVLLIYLPR
jgi:hypothetical protein